jgi:hypothetical protein
MIPTHYILLSTVHRNSRWFYHTGRKSYNSLYYGSVISNLTTLLLYHHAQFVVYSLYHQRLFMEKNLSSETCCGLFYFQRIFMSQRVYQKLFMKVQPRLVLSACIWYIDCLLKRVFHGT